MLADDGELDAADSPTLALTRVGDFDVALLASPLRLFLHDDGDSAPSARVFDVGARFGAVSDEPGREVLVETPSGARRVRLGAQVRFDHSGLPTLALPSLVAPLLSRLGVVGLVPLRGADSEARGYALLLDVVGLGDPTSVV